MATHTTWMQVGRLARGQVRSALMIGAIEYDLTCSIQEEKSLLDVTLIITLTGDQIMINRYLAAVTQMVRNHNGG